MRDFNQMTIHIVLLKIKFINLNIAKHKQVMDLDALWEHLTLILDLLNALIATQNT